MCGGRYHPDALSLEKCFSLLVCFCLLESRTGIFFAVTLLLQLEVVKLNVNLVTCNGCNGYVTVYVTLLPLHLPPLRGGDRM